MSTFGIQYSYGAGTTSKEPYGYRVFEPAGVRFTQLSNTFPLLEHYLQPGGLVVSSYPAALGLLSLAPFVDTYLHAKTLIRAMRLAARECRPTLFAAQPLVGADFLVRLVQSGFEIPERILLAAGGYYFPQSLEVFIRGLMAEHGCDLDVLHSYGVAEIGHSIFAAIDRFENGSPRFRQIASDVELSVDPGSNELTLARNGTKIPTGDTGFAIDGYWMIQPSERRLAPLVRKLLESWESSHWLRRTGYLLCKDGKFYFQVREDYSGDLDAQEADYYDFWKLSRSSFSCKPDWFIQSASKE